MPSSFVDSFPPIIKMLVELAPQRVIDVGPGWGKYGLACREYLPSIEALHAVEVQPGRLPSQDAIYDWTYTSDARILPGDFWGRWDTVLLIDVIEHMAIDDGHKLLGSMVGAGCQVLVSTPKQWAEQHDDHNPFETHISHWDWEDFVPYAVKRDVSTIDSIIYLLRKRP